MMHGMMHGMNNNMMQQQPGMMHGMNNNMMQQQPGMMQQQQPAIIMQQQPGMSLLPPHPPDGVAAVGDSNAGTPTNDVAGVVHGWVGQKRLESNILRVFFLLVIC
jgi:hypothetical protein